LQLTDDSHWGQQLLALLEHPQLQVRRAALMDLGAAGWRPALEPIRRTLAENSLKLMALRGLVENPAGPHATRLDEETTALLAVMDELL
jgi:phycocyanobilin lyase alpha subunit